MTWRTLNLLFLIKNKLILKILFKFINLKKLLAHLNENKNEQCKNYFSFARKFIRGN
jgi:hypothetical protein